MPRKKKVEAVTETPTAGQETAAPSKGFDDKPVTAPARSGETVTVACKIPNGFKMEFYRESIRVVEIKGGHETVKSYVKDGSVKPIFLNGPAAPFGQMPRGRVIGRAAFTPGVPKALWDRFCKENPKLDALVNRQIFAHSSESHLVGIAKEEKAVLSNQGPMAQGDDPRTPRRRDRTGKVGKAPAVVPGSEDEESA